MIPTFRVIVPAGGSGTRLWPLSRAAAPKFLLDLTGSGRTLLQATVDRLTPLTGKDGVVVVTGAKHERAVLDQLDISRANVLAEPSPRNSMAAIGLAAAVLAEREGDVVIGSFAADHVISGAGFTDAVRQAVVAAREGYLATVGIMPTQPSTGFGYIRSGDLVDLAAAPDVCHVESFTEKPDAATAAEYLETGEYFWNAGMFVCRAEVLLGHLERLHPDLHHGLRVIAGAWDTDRKWDAVERYWPSLPSIAIDHALAEPVAAEGGVVVVPGDFSWDDVGDFSTLAALLPADDAGMHVLGDPARVVAVDTLDGLVVPGSGRTITVLGLDDVVVVDTPDAVLVTTRERAQDVREVVEALKAVQPKLL